MQFAPSVLAQTSRVWVPLMLAAVGCAVRTGVAPIVYAQQPARRPGVYDVRARPIDLIPPGTVIPDGPPASWSHLIIKSHPLVKAGDVDKVPPHYQRLARRFSTAMLADVQRSGTHSGPAYHLGKLAVGCLTRIEAADTVISPDTHQQLGAQLGPLAALLLKEFSQRQQQVRVQFRSATAAVVDVPVAMRWQDANRSMVLRYALLVDSVTGELTVVLWMLNPGIPPQPHQLASPLERLPANYVEQCALYVDHGEYRLGVPTQNAYAALHMPAGAAQCSPSAELAALLRQRDFTPAQAAALDRSLRKLF